MKKILLFIVLILGVSLISASTCPSGVYPCNSKVQFNNHISPSGGLTINQINSSINGSYWTVGLDQNVAGGTKNGSFNLQTTGNFYVGSGLNYITLSQGQILFRDIGLNYYSLYFSGNQENISLKDYYGYSIDDKTPYFKIGDAIDKISLQVSGDSNFKNITANNICYSNGTNCQIKMNYTNVALTNQSNTFNGSQTIIGSFNLSNGGTPIICSNSSFTAFGTCTDSGLSAFGYKVIFNTGSAWNGNFYVPSPYRMFITNIGSHSSGADLIIDSGASKDIIFKNDNALNTTLIIKNTKIIANRSLDVIGDLTVTKTITATNVTNITEIKFFNRGNTPCPLNINGTICRNNTGMYIISGSG